MGATDRTSYSALEVKWTLRYSIGEVARQTGLSPSALRYYESIGVLPEPERASGRRRYGQQALDRLAMVDVAQRAGLTLRETATLLDGLEADAVPSTEWRELAQTKLREVDALIARAREMRKLLRTGLDCDCLALDDIEPFATPALTGSRRPPKASTRQVRGRGPGGAGHQWW